ncbi:MAG: type II 3-dehydroquinate dehydratase, partial [Clostridia bacterium]|nr:type II 3-dehydroquinate dehydratase [Clostridia bacterium]
MRFIKSTAKSLSISVKVKQFNSEENIVNTIQKAYNKFDGIIINAGAFTHTSVAILD